MKKIHTEGLALVFIQLNCQTVHSELFFFLELETFVMLAV